MLSLRMTTLTEIKERLSALVNNESLDDFEDWFVSARLNTHDVPDVLDLVFAIDDKFSQSQNDTELMAGLRSLASSLKA